MIHLSQEFGYKKSTLHFPILVVLTVPVTNIKSYYPICCIAQSDKKGDITDNISSNKGPPAKCYGSSEHLVLIPEDAFEY